MKAGADLEQAADPSPDLGAATRRRGDPRQDLQQRRLASAVPSDQPEHLAALDLERDAVERPEVTVTVVRTLSGATDGARERVAQRPVRRVVLAQPVALGDVLDPDDDLCHQICPRTGVRPSGSGQAEDEEQDCHRDTDRGLPEHGWRRAEDRPPPAGNHGRHRVERQDPLPLDRDPVEREGHAREQGEHLEEHGDRVGDVPVSNVYRREEQDESKNSHERQDDERGRDKVVTHEGGYVLYTTISTASTTSPRSRSTSGVRTAAKGSRTRGK